MRSLHNLHLSGRRSLLRPARSARLEKIYCRCRARPLPPCPFFLRKTVLNTFSSRSNRRFSLEVEWSSTSSSAAASRASASAGSSIAKQPSSASMAGYVTPTRATLKSSRPAPAKTSPTFARNCTKARAAAASTPSSNTNSPRAKPHLSAPFKLKEPGNKPFMSTQNAINCEPLKQLIRTVPDFPKPGILFYDITTLLKDKTGFAQLIDAFAAHYIGKDIDVVLGIEARGFIFGPALAYRLNAGFVPVRKPKKLPAPTAKVSYDLEYGTDSLEIHVDAIQPGQRVLIVDDLLATGGTMQATVQLVEKLGGQIVGIGFAIELDFLKGRNKFPGFDVFSLLHYDD